jgi:hypothetical protein
MEVGGGGEEGLSGGLGARVKACLLLMYVED